MSNQASHLRRKPLTRHELQELANEDGSLELQKITWLEPVPDNRTETPVEPS